MTSGRWIVLALLLLIGSPVLADDLEEALAASWQGAWVIIDTEIYSDCLPCDSINIVADGRVESDAVRRFDAGELGRVREIAVGRSRLDLRIDLVEPLLVSSPRGEFILYQPRACAIELRFEVPRDAVKGDDTALLSSHLESVLHRFPNAESARSSPSWNQRIRSPYPVGYEETRARFEQWRREWTKRAVTAARQVAYELLPRHGGDSYLQWFSDGVESVDPARWGSCDDLVDLPLPEVPSADSEGTLGGHAFGHALKLLAKLQECGLIEGSEPAP